MKSLNEYIIESQEINEGFKDYFSKLLEIITGKKEPGVKGITDLNISNKQINLFIKMSGAMYGSEEWIKNFVEKLHKSVKNDIELFVWNAREVKPIELDSVYKLGKKDFTGPGANLTALYDYIYNNVNTGDGEGDKKWLNVVLLDDIDVEIVRTDKEVSDTYFYAKQYNGNKNVFVKLEDIK